MRGAKRQRQQAAHQRELHGTPRQREMKERALANERLMKAALESAAAHRRGETGTSGRQLRTEAERRGASV